MIFQDLLFYWLQATVPQCHNVIAQLTQHIFLIGLRPIPQSVLLFLGLSRAILCNDALVKKLEDLEQTATMFRGLIHHTRRVLW